MNSCIMELHAGTWGLRMHPATSQLSPRARIIIYTLYINYTSNTNDKKKKKKVNYTYNGTIHKDHVINRMSRDLVTCIILCLE